MPVIQVTTSNVNSLETQFGDIFDQSLLANIRVFGQFVTTSVNNIFGTGVSLGNGFVITAAHNFSVSHILTPVTVTVTGIGVVLLRGVVLVLLIQ